MKSAALGLIRLYQRGLSPVQPARCRFVPSCSQYACEAIGHHGILKGGVIIQEPPPCLSIWASPRIGRPPA
ncbi:MAG: membrane protein insertion efficiency factor YidD [Dehalococcoidia bacterium]